MRISSDNTVIFLTACVNPNEMTATFIKDAHARKQMYLEAITYYYQKYNFPIVIVDNSDFDFNSIFTGSNNRFEALHFSGNNYDPSLGKGYGEGKIIEYGLKHSKLIQQSSIIIKITGRHIVTNLKSNICLINILHKLPDKFVLCNYCPLIESSLCDFFIADKTFYYDCLLNELPTCNEANGYWFEHLLYHCVRNAMSQKGYYHLSSPFQINQNSLSGSNGHPLLRYNFIEQLKNFMLHLSQVAKGEH